MLADGTILCPQCGTDAVVPASEVRNEGELQAWQHMSFPDTRDDEGGENESPWLNPFLSRRGDSGSNRQHYPDGDSEPNEAGALLDKDSSTRSCYRGPLVWGHTAACKGGLCLHRTCHEAPAPARRAPPRKPHGQPPPPRRQRRQRQTPARHHRGGAPAPGQVAARGVARVARAARQVHHVAAPAGVVPRAVDERCPVVRRGAAHAPMVHEAVVARPARQSVD